jgi:secondary thiamine-phosphate synthase enzyme
LSPLSEVPSRQRLQNYNHRSLSKSKSIEYGPNVMPFWHDLPAILDKLTPPSCSYGDEQAWHHGDVHSHLEATLLGPSLTVPIAEGKLVLGTWQQIFHLECDVRRCQRTIVVKVVGA